MSTPPALRHVLTIVAEVDAPLVLQGRSAEVLEFIPITGGTVTGPGISATVLPGGGDWCLTRADDCYRVEARYLFRTSSGEVVDVHNVGLLRHLDGGRGGYEEMGYFLCTPVFRTAADDLQWLTRSVFVGRARSSATDTTIDVFEVLG